MLGPGGRAAGGGQTTPQALLGKAFSTLMKLRDQMNHIVLRLYTISYENSKMAHMDHKLLRVI